MTDYFLSSSFGLPVLRVFMPSECRANEEGRDPAKKRKMNTDEGRWGGQKERHARGRGATFFCSEESGGGEGFFASLNDGEGPIGRNENAAGIRRWGGN